MDFKHHMLLGLPTYDGTRQNGMPIARLLKTHPPDMLVNLIEIKSSALAFCFNIMWANVLNFRNENKEVPPTHFLLWHADVIPQTDNWLPIMVSEMERTGADVLSAVIPIKNDLGMTSTARENPNGDKWRPLRYTTTEISVLPEKTWTTPELLVNTGLLLVDLSKPWVEEICFTMNDRIIKGEDGKFRAGFEPEDWNFSRQCHKLGVSVYATKAIQIGHMGTVQYLSDHVWGYATDTEYMRQTNEK